jgi:outer membrane lipoprotein-sorting protein
VSSRGSLVCVRAFYAAVRCSRSKTHSRPSAVLLVCLICVAPWLSACAAAIPKRPEGTAVNDAAAIGAFERATRFCRGLKTLSTEIRLSGRAGGERLRGTLHAGFAAPGALRFEAVAPFGPPVFVLAGRDNRATLLFPRDNRVLPDVALADVLDRLTALALSADDVRLVLSGCLSDGVMPTNGRSWNGGWNAVSLGNDITAYLQQRNGEPVIVAADYGPWLVDYSDHLNGWPRTVRIRSKEQGRVDAIARLDQLETNTEIDDRAFTVDIPPGAERITLNELRAIAPLRGSN